MPKTKTNRGKILIDYREDARWKVYAHINNINGKMYIGITSRKPEERWGKGTGYKKNNHFYNAIQKYGWDNFQHVIIANDLTEGEAKKFEIKLIAELNTKDPNKGYNISNGGDGVTGVSRYGKDNSFYGKHHTEEARKKMKENHYDNSGKNNPNYGKTHSDEAKKKIADAEILPVLQFDFDMNFIAKYRSSIEAAKNVGVTSDAIRTCCKGNSKTSAGFIWIYEKDYNEKDKYNYLKRLVKEKRTRPVLQFTLDMKFVQEYESCAEAGRQSGVGQCAIQNACAGRSKQSCGYIWKYKGEKCELTSYNSY